MARRKKNKSKPQKKAPDNAYNAKLTGILNEFQKLINDNRFEWIKYLSDYDVRFIYDSVSRANVQKNYQLTDKQAKYGASLLQKIRVLNR